MEPLEARLTELERTISRCRAEQVEILSRLDVLQVDAGDGDRGMEDWTSRTLDVSSQTAHRLMTLARHSDSRWLERMREGGLGLDRVSFLLKLEAADAPDELVEEAARAYSLGRLWGLVEQFRRLSPVEEQACFESRYLYLQPSLDQSAFRVAGLLYGVDAELVDKALRHRADTFPPLPGQSQPQGQLLADALVSVCADSLTGGSEDGGGNNRRAVTVAEVFIDAQLAAPTHGEAGVTTFSGLRAGPSVLEEILCDGKVRLIWTDQSNGPLRISHQTDTVAPSIRAFIWQRDQGQCSIAGCRSRHRLQIHHIREQSQGGDHLPPTWCSSAGITITSPSTESDSESISTPPPTGDG